MDDNGQIEEWEGPRSCTYETILIRSVSPEYYEGAEGSCKEIK